MKKGVDQAQAFGFQGHVQFATALSHLNLFREKGL
jgi:hypothetical protein